MDLAEAHAVQPPAPPVIAKSSDAAMTGAAGVATAEKPAPGRVDPPMRSGPVFVSGPQRVALLERARQCGHAVIDLPSFSPLRRGRLFELIEDASDAFLARVGAPAPGLKAFGTHEDRITDRLFRATRHGMTGLTFVLGSLRPLAASALRAELGLAPEDGDTLSLVGTMAKDRPITIVMEERDADLGVFRETSPLRGLFERPRAKRLAKTEARLDSASVAGVVAPSPAIHATELECPRNEPRELTTDPRSMTPSADETGPSAPAPALTATPERTVKRIRPAFDGSSGNATATTAAPAPPSTHVFLPVSKAADAGEARVVVRPATMPPREHPWRTHAAALVAARGPQPLGEFERLFAEHYVPLTGYIERGVEDPRARAAAEEFRHTFARSYSEAFPTFMVTGKRPRLVLDAPEIAGRTGRLHGARSTQLLLVDGMRWDIGILVRDALVVGLGPGSTLAEESFLLASLPSTTPRQLAGLARGLDGLRSPTMDEGEGEALRGRTSEIVRRIRVGSREIYKLDAVESRLREADGHAVELFPEIARRVSDAIVRHAATLAPRTLLYVFGDHGFSVDNMGMTHQGGASPEEVLVPAFAFLLGMVQ